MSRRFQNQPFEHAPIDLTIDSLDHLGRGIAHHNGKVVFVRGALPQERVSARITYEKARFAEAQVISVTEPSAHRITPACSAFGRCGGCVLQHMHPEKQILYKQSVLAEQLTHFGKVSPEAWLPPLLDHSFGYRTKARLGMRLVPKKGGVLIGFREQNGHYLTDTHECPILHPSVGAQLPLLKAELGKLENPACVPQIEVIVDDHRTALIVRHLSPFSTQDLCLLRELETKMPCTIYLQPKGPDSIEPLSVPAHPNPFAYGLPAYDLTLRFGPSDFTQINLGMNQKMVALALELLALEPGDRALDLFCGIGNFTLPMARTAQSVLGIEGEAAMTLRALENAESQGLHNVKFAQANLFEITGHEDFFNTSYNKILLDPPRTGAEPLCRLLSKLAPKRIVYVSCNPATFSRDLGILVNEGGFTLNKVGVLDMFPHTAHVESIALLTPKSAA